MIKKKKEEEERERREITDSVILCINLNAFYLEFLFSSLHFLYSFGLLEDKFIDLNQYHGLT